MNIPADAFVEALGDGVVISIGAPNARLVSSDSILNSRRQFNFSDLRFREKIQRCGLRLPTGRNGLTPRRDLIVGECDRIVLDRTQASLRMVSLDTLSQAFKRCDLLSLTWSAEIASLLKSGDRFISVHKPFIAIFNSSLGPINRQSVLDLFSGLKYQLVLETEDAWIFAPNKGQSLPVLPFSLSLLARNLEHRRAEDRSSSLTFRADELMSSTSTFEDSQTSKIGVWTTQSATRFLAFLPTSGFYNVELKISDHQLDSDALGQLRQYDKMSGQTTWSVNAEHVLAARIYCSRSDVYDGCLFTLVTTVCGHRELSGEWRQVGVKIDAIKYTLEP